MASKLTSNDKNSEDWRCFNTGVIPKLNYSLNNETFADVSFKFPNGETVKAHKLLLALNSTVFEKMFNGQFAESSQPVEKPIEVKDVDQDVFRTMLEFIYTGKFAMKEASSEHILNTLYASVKYAVYELQTICSDELKLRICDETVINIFQGSKLLKETDLTDNAMPYLQRHFERLLKSDEFLEFSLENLSVLLEDSKTCIDDELQLFTAMLKWSEAECLRQNLQLSPGNQRSVLGKVLSLVQFTKMKVEDVSLEVVPSGILTSEEVILLFQHMTVSSDKMSQLGKYPFKKVTRLPRRMVYSAKFVDCPRDTIFDCDMCSMTFSVSQPVAIVGCGIWGPRNLAVESVTICGVIQLFKTTPHTHIATIADGTVIVKNNSIFDMDFGEPVPIFPNEKYTLTYEVLKGPPVSFSLVFGRTTVNVDIVENEAVKFVCEPGATIAEIRFKPVSI